MFNKLKVSRRHFTLKALATFSAVLAAKHVVAQTAPKPTGGDLPESDPVAKALGYYADASKVDVKKWPKKAGPEGTKQNCANCQLYQAQAGETARGGCTLFPNRWVSTKGWCNGYIPKA